MDLRLCYMYLRYLQYLQMCLKSIWSREIQPYSNSMQVGKISIVSITTDLHQVIWQNLSKSVRWFPSWAVAALFWGGHITMGMSLVPYLMQLCGFVCIVLERCVPVILYFCPCLCGNAFSSKDSLGEIAKAFHLILEWHICMFFSSVQQILSAEGYFSNDPRALLYQHTNSHYHCDLDTIGK